MSNEEEAGEIEQERRREEAGLDDEDQEWREKFAPGSFGCHELLDRVNLALRLLDESVVTHPACVQNPEWYALARQASETLAGLYQRIGAEHL